MSIVDASEFFLGHSQTSGCESYLFFRSDGQAMSVKWHNFKVVHRYCDGIDKPIVTPFLPMFFDLESDPQERYNLTDHRFDLDFMFHVLLQIVMEYELSLLKYPNIKPGSEFSGYGSDAEATKTNASVAH